jgi:DNA repair protein RadC
LNSGQPLLIAAGGQSDARVDQRILFRRLLDAQAHAFICVHNHPAGSLKPSREDQAVTELLAKCGELLGIELLDHIIVSAEGARSMRHE